MNALWLYKSYGLSTIGYNISIRDMSYDGQGVLNSINCSATYSR